LRKALPYLFTPLLVALIASGSASVNYVSLVISVLDGDTIEVLHNKQPERIRLNGNDCPEKGQAFGQKAKQATSALVSQKEVSTDAWQGQAWTHDCRRAVAGWYKRQSATGQRRLVLPYQKYAPDSVILAELQRRARRSGLGLWADPGPVPPWEWRKLK
jgi:micrococcal nuclease